MGTFGETGKHMSAYITISKDEYESMQRTIAVLGDKELINQINLSKNAKTRDWTKVKRELGL